MNKDDLREVSITFNGTDTEYGRFHRWFDRSHEDGTTALCAVVELRGSGIIKLFSTDVYQITFLKEKDPLDKLN